MRVNAVGWRVALRLKTNCATTVAQLVQFAFALLASIPGGRGWHRSPRTLVPAGSGLVGMRAVTRLDCIGGE
jgi:hypothetical protein